MRARHLPWMPRLAPALVATLLLAGAVASGSGQAAASPWSGQHPPGQQSPGQEASGQQAPGVKQVLYQGYTFDVPESWPVIDEALKPTTCVRFDQHVVYLGGPGPNQSCPSWLFGTTEAVLIESGPESAPRSSVENPVARQITVTAPRIRITATFNRNPNVLYTMLAKAGLPAPQIQLPDPAVLDAAEGRPGATAGGPAGPPAGEAQPDATELAYAARHAAGGKAAVTAPASMKAIQVRLPELPAAVANFHGLGFDACAAPSAAYMRKWRRHSPYRAVGIYIGGSDRACNQNNLTAAWVRREASAGWHFIPMYVGPQASFGELTSGPRQGNRAAADAVVQARRLGFGPRTPIYYDMEAYPPKRTGAALRFLSAWTKALHRLGYRSGVYSSSRSGVVDLARQYAKHKYAMPDAIYDALWNGAKNVSDRAYTRKSWPATHRLHQFSGNDTQTFGGATIDVDKDYLNVRLAAPGGTMQATQAVASSSVFYRGKDDRLWRNSRRAHGKWSRPIDMGGKLGSRPSVVAVGRSTLDVFYRGKRGTLWLVQRTAGGWHRARKIPLMGDLGSAPRAAATPNGVIDVFWKGSHDHHLWHGQYSPGHGWSGPQRLGGDLAGAPWPVENRSGGIQVFWEGGGKKRQLWHVTRHLGGSWSHPASLGMGPLGGAPRATVLPSGSIVVVWRGSTRPHHVWSAFLRPGHRAQGPRSLGGSVRGGPVPEAAKSTARVFFRGSNKGLWQIVYRSSGRWHSPSRVRMGKVRAGPWVAAGAGRGPFEVFWKGRKGGLWSATGAGSRWKGPQRLRGRPR